MSEWFGSFSRVRAPKSRWKAPLLGCGAVIHAALFTGMWAKGLWEIKKVDVDDNQIALSLPPNPPQVAEAPAGAPKPPTPTHKRAARGPTQPSDVPVKTPPEDTGGTAPVGPAVPTDGIPTALPDPLPPVELPPVKLPALPQPPPAPAKPRLVEQSKLERVSGETGIAPDSETAQQIARAGNEARGAVRLCINTSGSVESATVARSTHFEAYDAKLERETRQWRYRPFLVDGVPTPVCTLITFIYRQR
jgi:periplasmic protein TonB